MSSASCGSASPHFSNLTPTAHLHLSSLQFQQKFSTRTLKFLMSWNFLYKSYSTLIAPVKIRNLKALREVSSTHIYFLPYQLLLLLLLLLLRSLSTHILLKIFSNSYKRVLTFIPLCLEKSYEVDDEFVSHYLD